MADVLYGAGKVGWEIRMVKKARVLLYGLGKRFIENKEVLEKEYDIVAIADCDSKKHGRYGTYDVVSPLKICEYSFDRLIITPKDYQGILPVLQALEIPNEKLELLISDKIYEHTWKKISMRPLYDGGVCYRFDNIHFLSKNHSDYLVMWDIFGKKGWDFYCREKVVVVDIGMNIGLSCLYFANMENVDYVYGYEPFVQTYEQALKNFGRNPEEIRNKIRPTNCGLTDRESRIEVSYNPHYTTNMRVDEGIRTHGETEEKVWVQTKSAGDEISAILKRHENEKIVLKMDCEGSEYPIFQDLKEKDILKDVCMILMETHDGREDEIKKILKDQGFVYFDNYIGGFMKLGFIYAVNPEAR